MTNTNTVERVTATGRTIQKDAFEAKREVRVGRYTRAKKNHIMFKGSYKHRAIWSPCCDETVVVGHFSWSALICRECGSEVGKYSWLTL